MTSPRGQRRLELPVHRHVRFVLLRPHYPENLGAAARALKTMGFDQLWLVKPGKLCSPDHEMAFKMAVKSWDVLSSVRVVDALEAALEGCAQVVATTARRGIRGAMSPRELARTVIAGASRGERTAVLFGNEKTGLAPGELGAAGSVARIPMAADQPSINLAQAVQIMSYELLLEALASPKIR